MKRVIFYLVDGARPDILHDLVGKGLLPNIKKYLIDAGSHATGTTCFPSTTGPAYLPYLTGSSPGDHDITGIRWFDKAEYFLKNRWARNAMRSYCGYEAKYFNDDMNPDYPSLFEEYEKGYNLYNMITKGVKEENDVTKEGKTKLYFRAHFYHEHHPVDIAGGDRLLETLDKDFQFIFAVFPSVDWDSHTYHYADEKTIKAYQIADKNLGAVVDKLKSKGIYDDTMLIMASDHGLTSTHTHLDLGKYFRKKGYRILEYPRITSWFPNLAVFISGNSFGTLTFLDQKEMYEQSALEKKHGKALDEFIQEDAIDLIIYRKTNTEYVVRNASGSSIVGYDDQGYTYDPGDTDVLGLSSIPNPISREQAFDLCFDTTYPDSLYQISQLMKSGRSGDVVVSAAVGYDLRDFWEIPEHKGSHGSLHKEHLHVPLLSSQKVFEKNIPTTEVHRIIKNWLEA